MSEHDTRAPSKREVLIGHVVRRGIPLLALALVVGGAYLFLDHVQTDPKHEEAKPAGAPMSVSVLTVRRDTVPVRPRYLGRTAASQVVEIRARIAGHLRERMFQEGTFVEKGQPLFRIDPRPFENDLARAEARLRSAQATLDRAQAQVRRFEGLTERQSATRGELEEWLQQEGVAAAEVELARAEIAGAMLNIEYATIEAPIPGMIGEALRQVGSYVDSAGNGLMAVLQQVDPIDVRFSVTERDVLVWQRRADAGELISPPPEEIPVLLTLADGSTYPHEGRITFTDVNVGESTGTLIVRATFPNPDGLLRPGQFVHASLLGINRVDVISVPRSAILQSASGAGVFVVNAEGTVELRLVTLGDWSGDKDWIVERGLLPGDRVVTSRLLMMRPGMPVTATEAASAAPPADDRIAASQESAR